MHMIGRLIVFLSYGCATAVASPNPSKDTTMDKCFGIYVDTTDTWTGCEVHKVGTLDCFIDKVDMNGDDAVSRHELTTYIATLPMSFQRHWIAHGIYDQLFRADTTIGNADTYVDLVELNNWMSCQAAEYLPSLLHGNACA